jgi:hypothetical protein
MGVAPGTLSTRLRIDELSLRNPIAKVTERLPNYISFMWLIDQRTVQSEVLAGEAVIVDFTTGRYHAAAGVAATVWEAMKQGQEINEIMREVRSSHTDVPEDAESSVLAFIDSIVDAGLAKQADAEVAPTSSSEQQTSPVPTPWIVPLLESHNDLADLMLIDPVHDVTARGWPNVPSANS